MVHILPHWNLKGREGEDIPVWVYTNCEEVELWYNGQSQGRKTIEKYGHGEWTLTYEPGEVSCKGYIGGKEVASDRVATTGKPVALKLEMQTEALFASKWDCAVVHCYCVDENGNKVPDAAPMVHFNCTPNGYIRGTGSDIADHTPMACADRKMRAGVVAACIHSNGTEGIPKVYAHADELESASLETAVTQPNDKIR